MRNLSNKSVHFFAIITTVFITSKQAIAQGNELQPLNDTGNWIKDILTGDFATILAGIALAVIAYLTFFKGLPKVCE